MDDGAATQPITSSPRRWGRIGLAFALFMLIASAVVWVQRIAIAEFIVQRVADSADIGPVELTIEHLGLSGTTIASISIGGAGGQKIGRLEAGYSLNSLYRGYVDSLSISEAHFQARQGPDGPVFAGIPQQRAPKNDAPFTNPVRNLRFEAGRLRFASPDGDIVLTADGRVESPDGQTSDIAAAIGLGSDWGSFKGKLTATRLASGELFGRADIQAGQGSFETVRAAGVRGAIQFLALGNRKLELDANIKAATLSAFGEEFGETHANFGARSASDGRYAVEATIASAMAKVDVAGTVNRSESGTLAAAATFETDLQRDGLRAGMTGESRFSLESNGRMTAALKVDRAAAAYHANALSGLKGTVQVERAQDGALKGEADLKFQRFSAAGIDGQPGSISVRLDDTDLAIQAALDWTNGTLRVSANGPLEGPVRFKTHGKTASVQGLAGHFMDIEAVGAASFAFEGSIKNPPDAFHNAAAKPLSVLPNVDAKGWFESAIHNIDLPGFARGVSLTGRTEFDLNADGVRLSTPKLQLAVGALENEVATKLPRAIRNYVASPVRLTIRPQGAGKATVQFAFKESGAKVDVNAALQMQSGGTEISLGGPFEASVDASGQVEQFHTDRATIDLSAVLEGRGKAEAKGAVTDLRYEGDKVAGKFDFSATYNGIVDERLAPLSASSRIGGRIAMDGDTLSATVAPGGMVSVGNLELHDTANSKSPVSAKLSAPLRASIDVAQGLPSITYNARLLIAAGQFSAKTGKHWTKVEHAAIPVTATGSGTGHHLDAQTKAIEIHSQKLRINGVGVKLELGQKVHSTLTAETIEHQGIPAFFTPLRFTAAMQANRAGRMTFEGQLFDPPERISVSLSGHHDTNTNSGELAVDARKLVFLPTVLQPAQLFPILGSTLREVDGSIDALAKFAWHEDEVESSLELLIDAKLIEADEFKFENTATVVRFDSLLPPSTPAGQEVSIGLLDVGVPMQNGRLEFQLNKDGSVRAALRELDFFGGRVETPEFMIPATFNGFTVPLQVNGVALENLLALAKSGDLAATGTLNGSIPVTIKDGDVAIRNGVLETAPGGGTIRYQPTAIGPSLANANEGMKLFLKIVEDFQYDKVKVMLDEDELGDVAFGFKIEGRNQAVYKGIPVELNVSMDGPLRKILGQGLKTYKLPERLLSDIKRFKDRN